MNRVLKFVYSFIWSYVVVCQSEAMAEDFDLTSLSIEQLMESKVTSVSRTSQMFSDTAAAAYVITQEDIQRFWSNQYP